MSDRAIEALKAAQGAARVIGYNGFLQKLLEAEGVRLHCTSEARRSPRKRRNQCTTGTVG